MIGPRRPDGVARRDGIAVVRAEDCEPRACPARSAGTHFGSDFQGRSVMADETQSVEQEDQEADASGGDDAQGKTEQREERDPPAGDEGEGGDSGDEDSEAQKAQEKEEEREQAADKVKELEEDPPADLEDWPDDAAKYETFGGPEGEHGYHEGPEEKLGPSSLRHHEDGKVTVAGEEVDDPDEYKSDPIPGGPTDPEASQDLTTEKIRERQGRDLESEDGDSDDDSDDDSDSGDEEREEAGATA
jgi:hypothetical protein